MDNKPHKFSFEGRAVEYFGLWLINSLLRAFTLGLYYPWAKTNLRKFFYNNTKLEGNSFSYHGNGMELFKGLLKAIAILIGISGIGLLILWGTTLLPQEHDRRFQSLYIIIKIIWGLFLSVTPFLLFPVALHGSIKYLMQRISWRGIYFSYNGRLKDLIFIYLKYGFLVFMGFASFFGFTEDFYATKVTIITPTLLLFLVAIFYTTFFVETRGYLFNNITWGNVEVRWYGDGVTFFMLRLRFLFPILLLIFYLHFSIDTFISLSILESPQILIQLGLAVIFFVLMMIFTYIWYLHGYLHFVFSNFRLFQGDTECEVWHESTFGNSLKTCLIVVCLLLGGLSFIVTINTVCTVIIAAWACTNSSNNGLSETYIFQNFQIMLMIRILSFAAVMAMILPFIIIFLMRWVINGVRLESKLDLEHLGQNEGRENEGFSDDLSDMFNIDLV